MKTVFIYEHLSGGATDAAPAGAPRTAPVQHAGDAVDASGGAEDAAALRAAGRAMRDAVVADLLAGGGFAVGVAADASSTPRFADLAAGGGFKVSAPSPVGAAADPAIIDRTPDGHPVASTGAALWTLAPRPGETAVEFVTRQTARHDLTWVVAPETGGLLGRLCAVVEPRRWLGCQPAAIALASSKRATTQRLAAQGLCTPLAFETDRANERWVVKPDDGAGALATRRHRSRAAADADAAARHGGAPAHVVEPWVDGHPLSLSLLCDAGGVELLSVNRQSIGVDAAGRVSFEGVDANVLSAVDARSARLHALARQIGAAIGGLRGFVGVDLVWHTQRGPVVIEVNPRVTSAYVGLPAVLARRLAADVVAAHLREQGDG